jgi:hypothetical protein
LILKRQITCCGVVGLLLLGITTAALSQEDPSDFGEAWKTWELTKNPRDLIEAYRVWKLTESLDLSEEQMPVFFSRLREIDKQDADFRREELKALGHISNLLERGDADDADLDRALQRYEDVRRRHLEEVRKSRREAAELLTVRQRCQYLVFEERFKTHLKNMIGRVRELRGQQGLDRGGEFERPEGQGERGGIGPGGSQRGGSGGSGGSGGGGSGRGRR